MSFVSNNNNDKFKKNEIIHFNLCITQSANYIKCLNLQNEIQNQKINCEEIRKEYLSCINNNFNRSKVNIK